LDSRIQSSIAPTIFRNAGERFNGRELSPRNMQPREAIDRGNIGCQPPPMPQRERYLFVCTNRRSPDNEKGSCADKGSEEIRLALKEQLAARGLAQLRTRVCASSCLDQCSSGVCILVEPDHFFYGRVTMADLPEIVEGIASGQRVQRLVLTEEDLAKG
jgi:(2Fe-2S) ferredoxin